MPEPALHLLAMLLAAHALGDFVLQTARDVQRKRELPVLLKHSFVHALLCVVLAAGAVRWEVPVAIFVTHAALDWIKARWAEASAGAFLADQVGHLAVIVLASLLWSPPTAAAATGWGETLGVGSDYARVAAVLAGAIVTVRGGRFLLALFIRPYLDELEAQASDDRPSSLRNAGQTIGELERLLIFVLVMAGQPGAVGFLIAAKSVFRFGELKESAKRMESEYIIIGTLASFGYAISISIATRALWTALG